MEINFIKEQHHNYLVIRKNEEIRGIDYQEKMLTNHRMKYLLDVSSRCIDGENYHYYDISSKLSLRQLYGSKYMDIEDICRLMSDVQRVYEEIDQYLLDTERLLINPDCIFYNYSSQLYLFLYNISSETQNTGSGVGELMDFLLERVNPVDAGATDKVYEMYELYEKGEEDIWELAALIMNSEKAAAGTIDDDNKSLSELVYSEPPLVNEYEDGSIPNDSEYFDRENSPGVVRRKRIPLLIGVVGLIGIVAGVVGLIFFEFTKEETIILLSMMGTALVLFCAGLFVMVKDTVANHKRTDNKEMTKDESDISEYEYKSVVNMDSFIDKSGKHGWKQSFMEDEPENDNCEEGHTVFFDGGGDKKYKLYALDKKNKQHIELGHFPYTIGKLSGYADCCLEHPSISRLHARIDQKENQLYVSDLNSTNGVYLNGIRLKPNEARQIDEGDEIRLGALNYCLRTTG